MQYFSYARKEIEPLLPEVYTRVLEIGCGAGSTLAWLKSTGGCQWCAGVEINAEAADIAQRHIDEVYIGNIESLQIPIQPASLDLLLCLDVLEHTQDPWILVKRMAGYLRPGGVIIASIPNVRYWKVSLPLLFLDKWQYTDAGVLDRTHLRFFVKSTALDLLSQGGFSVTKVLSTGLGRSKKSQFVNRLIPETIINLLTYQFLIQGVKQDG